MTQTPGPPSDPYADLGNTLTSVLPDDAVLAALEDRIRRTDDLRGVAPATRAEPEPAFARDLYAPRPATPNPAVAALPPDRALAETRSYLTGATLATSVAADAADPLLVDLLAHLRRLHAGGLVSPFATDAINTGLSLIDRLKTRVATVTVTAAN